jgi:hypothetical protein
MSQHIRVADKLKRQSAEQLVTMAGAVISGLTGNPAFPASTVDLKAVQAAADALKTALVAQAQGGTAATADKNNKQEALIVLLRKKSLTGDYLTNFQSITGNTGRLRIW